jgi:hypothetical protein
LLFLVYCCAANGFQTMKSQEAALRQNLTGGLLPRNMRQRNQERTMASNSHAASPPKVPAELLAERRKGWQGFTRFTVMSCAAIAVTLLMMLVFLRIL